MNISELFCLIYWKIIAGRCIIRTKIAEISVVGGGDWTHFLFLMYSFSDLDYSCFQAGPKLILKKHDSWTLPFENFFKITAIYHFVIHLSSFVFLRLNSDYRIIVMT